ncbi:MAG: recombinase family protein [Alsobacter sp.]
MTKGPTKRLRCAIYTRVSTDHGLEQDFNSLDAQRDAAEAYIKSQAHEGWTLIRTAFDDGGFSGGSMERPALQRLLADIRSGKIDVIVVYKVDRLTRSLADFAKLVELFDANQVSFVSVTQSFNTTTSMGRLTLNVLLSFAQFEREVTSERIRDKIGASKKRGLWVGGMVPLGYASQEKKLVVVEEEAERVRLIFRRYLELGSLNRLLRELRDRGIVTKLRMLSTGRTRGGIRFTRGSLAYLLRNRFYIGEVVYRGSICPAEHEPILDRSLFEAVQHKLTGQQQGRARERHGSQALLTGKLFDDKGNRMSPSHARKAGRTYRYYISSALHQGRREELGSVPRVSAPDIEAVIVRAVREHCPVAAALSADELIERHLVRARLSSASIVLDLLPHDAKSSLQAANGDADQDEPTPEKITIAWTRAPTRRARDIILPKEAGLKPVQPIDASTRATLVRSIALGRRWLAEIVAGRVESPQVIASREGCSPRRVTMMISLAFVAPELVRAAIDGRLPRGIGFSRLVDPPAEWSRQAEMLGLPSPHTLKPATVYECDASI